MGYESVTRGSIIQSFNHLLLVSITIESETDRSTDLLWNSKNNQWTNIWMDKRCSFYAVNNNNKIIITNKWYSATRILYIQSFFHSVICYCFYLVNAWLMDESMPILMLLSIQVQQTTRQKRIATTMKLVVKMDIKIVDW